MSVNKQPYISLLIVVVVVGGLIILNKWLVHQMDEIQSEPTTTVQALPTIEVKDSKRYGKPVIDPYNDPLAPMVKQVQKEEAPKPAPVVSSPLDEKKTYEAAEPSPILVQ